MKLKHFYTTFNKVLTFQTFAAMASKAFSLFLFTLLLLPLLSHGTSRNINNKKSSPFDFLKHLQGCHKGDNVSGIKVLKRDRKSVV